MIILGFTTKDFVPITMLIIGWSITQCNVTPVKRISKISKGKRYIPKWQSTRGSVGWACVARLSFCFEETWYRTFHSYCFLPNFN